MTAIIKDMSALTPKAQEACKLFLSECENQGLKVRITETYRSQERQNDLYAQGRTKAGQIVTWTKKSRHTSRRAWDICQDIKGQEYSDSAFFAQCGEIAKGLGITWGGTWKIPDKPHFEIDESWEVNKMTDSERQKFNALVGQVEKLTLAQEKVYHYTKELPEHPDGTGRATVQKLLDKKLFFGKSESDLNLPETLFRLFCVNDRAGLYDKEQYYGK